MNWAGEDSEPTYYHDAADVARALGGDVYRGAQVLAPGPGHRPEDRSLHIWLDPNYPDGFRVCSYADDPWQECRDYVRDKLGIDRSYRRSEPYKPRQPKPRDMLALARRLWDGTRDPRGSIVDDYLHITRGLEDLVIPPTIRFRPAQGQFPDTMVTAFCEPVERDGELIKPPAASISGVHFTYLARVDGQAVNIEHKGKTGAAAKKRTLGPSMGIPLALAPPNDGLGLVVAEGIEDALSAQLATGLGAWAAGTAGRMSALARLIPDYIECVTILADADEAGQNGTAGLAELLTERGIEVFVDGLERRA
jgi:hypothetical protein